LCSPRVVMAGGEFASEEGCKAASGRMGVRCYIRLSKHWSAFNRKSVLRGHPMRPTLAIRSGGSVKEHVKVIVEKCGDALGAC
jgi:hypothetical protein